MASVITKATIPAHIVARRPNLADSAPNTSDGKYMPAIWDWMTHLVASREWPACSCMLIGVAVMRKVMTP